MKPLATLIAALFLIAGMVAQAYDVNDPRYNPYAVPHKPYQPYQPSNQPEPSAYERSMERIDRAERRAAQQRTPAWQANRNSARQGCAMISNNAYAQSRCYESIR